LAELQQKHDLMVEWLPFELRPEPAPLPDMSGPDRERFRQNWERGVAPLAAEFGVEMRFPDSKPRSRLAHETAEFARERGKFEATRRAIFEAFFVHNRDIGQVEVLLDIARSVGLPGDELGAALAAGHYAARVADLEGISDRLGISVVPTIVIGELGVQGVRPYPVLRQVLEAAERRAGSAR
jgi:predicted DsbA family dithiol-disulfide isomerase